MSIVEEEGDTRVLARGPVNARRRFVELAREPFVHFLLLGALLFGLFALLEDQSATDGGRIDITAADLEQLQAMFTARWMRAPTESELKGLIEDRIREEVLYREALALGLDKDDTIVRRRLAQKLEFLATDIGALAEPDEAALKAYYAREQERYREPGRLSFTQTYFSTDKRGARAVADAQALLAQLRDGGGQSLSDTEFGDQLLLAPDFVDHGIDEVARDFGPAFAEGVARLPVGKWQGPVNSAFGVHLVYVNARSEARLPEFGEVRERVARDYLDEQRRAAKDKMYEQLRSRYEIHIPEVPPASASHKKER